MNEESLFCAARELPTADERRAYLDRMCAGDETLRQRLESLLEADKQSLEILDQSAGPAVDSGGTARGLPGAGNADGLIGATIADRYTLLEEIGEGGMGNVWAAEQSHPVRRKVALKLIKPGMDSRSVLSRFEAERQALAMMDHPNIARVLDGGTTDAGRPYFVMEYVKGAPITEYCDEARLGIAERLELFVPVCRAVQHAHTKGVIHRDIKPSNILVCLYDCHPVPKVIDFGLAKAVHEPLTAQTVRTAHGAVMGTPLYMSPEQAQFNNLDVDTRTDVYALGVVLYELLTGTTPQEGQRFERMPWDEVLRLIREDDPPRPSVRLSSSELLPALASRRQIDPNRLARMVRGDLDWIVMKCLEKNRSRRYQTANGLADDVQRYLLHEPVTACPPTARYRMRKFARRHRVALLTATTVVSLLVVGVAVATWQAVRATRAESNARAAVRQGNDQRAIAQSVNDFMSELLGQADIANQTSGVARDPDIKVRTLLDRAARRIEDGPRQHPLAEAAVRLTLGKAHRALGEFPEARKHLQRSLELRTRELGWNDGASLDIAYHVARLHFDLREDDEAEALYTQLIKLRHDVLGADHPETLRSMNDLGELYRVLARFDDAEHLIRGAFDGRLARLGQDHPDTLGSMDSMGGLCWSRGHLSEAARWYEQARDGWRAKLGSDHPSTLGAGSNLALVYMGQKRLDEAESLLTQLLATASAVLEPDHPLTLDIMHNLAGLHASRARDGEAETLMKRVAEAHRRKKGVAHADTLRILNNLASLYVKTGRFKEAEPIFVEVLDAQRRTLGSDHPETLITMHNLGVLFRDTGRYLEAEPLLRDAAEGARAKLGLGHANTHTAIENFAFLQSKQGTPERAEQLLRDVVSYLCDQPGADPIAYATQLGFLSISLVDQEKYAEAEPFARECLAIRVEKRPDSWPRYYASCVLGAALLGQRKYGEAEPLLLEGYTGMKTLEDKIPPISRDRLPYTLERLVQLYEGWGKPDQAALWRAKLLQDSHGGPTR